MAVYERRSGDYVAESVRPEPGSDEEAALAALAEDPGSGWRLLAEPAPQKPSGRRAKAGES